MTQIEPPVQVSMLIERKLYSTGLKFCDFLILNAYEGMRQEDYEKLQKEKGFYNFIIKKRFELAEEIFQRFRVPVYNVILLFKNLYPEIYIRNMTTKFKVDLKQVPFLPQLQVPDLKVFSS